ncbi:GNAT family N-acetyltransferase [bacterium D16-51]|nr:GNAT family N-acetyltransferase [bacterium D16-59]RKI59948.1 GNAT family N-acetyltransferase [bacterium D16-51]
MNIELVRLTGGYREQLVEMLTEWKNDIIVNHTDMSPWKIWANDFQDFDYYLENLDTTEENKEGWVPDTTLFCLDKDRDIFVGAVNIRHYLNGELLKTGGHIGDGIRPSERRKGYATAMLALALEECKKLGISKVLVCCDKDNIGSAKSILNNGGVLENEVEEDGHVVQRYWIDLVTKYHNI